MAGAEACFAQASRFLYCEPDYAEVAGQVTEAVFASAPFGEGDECVLAGLGLLSRWCQAEAARAEGGGLRLVDAESLQASPAFRQSVEALRREWLRLFAGVGAPQVSCLESFYVESDGHMFAESTLEVRRAYRRHGLQIERLHSEPDDHLGLMLGFVSHLIGLEIEAEEAGDAARALALSEEQDEFLTGHILPWLSVWRYHVAKNAKSDYYRGAGEFVFGLCAAYAARFGIRYDAEARAFKRSRS